MGMEVYVVRLMWYRLEWARNKRVCCSSCDETLLIHFTYNKWSFPYCQPAGDHSFTLREILDNKYEVTTVYHE